MATRDFEQRFAICFFEGEALKSEARGKPNLSYKKGGDIDEEGYTSSARGIHDDVRQRGKSSDGTVEGRRRGRVLHREVGPVPLLVPA